MINRRTVIKGALALGVYLAMPSSIKELKANTIRDFQDGVNKGKITNMSFEFNHPIELVGLDYLIIERCNFIFTFQSNAPCITVKNCKKLSIIGCSFKAPPYCQASFRFDLEDLSKKKIFTIR